MIGKNVKLYDMVLQFLRTLFLRTRNVHYCTLRAELLMSLHDLEISEICTVDPCHKVSVMWGRWEYYCRIVFDPLLWYLLPCRTSGQTSLWEESSALESQSHLIVLGTSGENSVLVNQQLAFISEPMNHSNLWYFHTTGKKKKKKRASPRFLIKACSPSHCAGVTLHLSVNCVCNMKYFESWVIETLSY